MRILCAVLVCVCSLGAAPVAAAPAALTTTQLPRTIRPIHYDLTLEPDAANLRFSGRAKIDIEVLQPTKRITVNAADLAFSAVTLSGAAGKQLASKVTVDSSAESASFNFANKIASGRYTLVLDYTGKIGTQAVGLFALDYAAATGPRRALYTQFENAYARRMLPCWDEPAFRASFALEVVVPTGQMAVSNMPAESTAELGDGRSRVRFAPTPAMSSYLLFFALGEFERRTMNSAGVEVGVVTKQGVADQAEFALRSSAAVLAEYNDYFATPYPLPKLDNIAAPGRSQFFGAMENWGAIFTFEHAILLDPAIASQRDRQHAFTIAAHEIAHQWFGNLVTMRWWDDLWLNEGFASWLEGRTTRRLHPEWNTALKAVAVRERGMARDALATSHPVVQHVESVEQASQAFDSITYSKGEAVIGMLEDYVGAAAWKQGVRNYIKAHAYRNSVSDDLWREIEAAAGLPVTAIAHDFTLQAGVPLIRVESASCAEGKTTLKLTQGEFSRDRPHKAPRTWRVPVILQAPGGAPVRVLVRGRRTVSVPGCAPVIVNAGQSGYYRTLYAPAQFRAIAARFASLASIDQLGLMADAWALGLAGQQPMADFLDLARASPLDADSQVWEKIADVFDEIDGYYRGDALRQSTFRRFASARLTPALAKLGWVSTPTEADTTAMLRNKLVVTLGALGDAAVIDEARRRFAARATDPNAMPPGLRKTILGVVAHHADAATWEELHAEAQAAKVTLIRDQFYELLASPEDVGLARRALELALTSEPGATNSAAMIGTVAELHPDLAVDFAMAHLAAVNARVDATSRSRYFPHLATKSADPAMITKLRAYAAANLAAGSRRETENVIINIAERIRLRRERLPAIDAWLAAPRLGSGIDLQYMDAQIRPQDDFYRHVSGKWLATAEIPADRARYGAFDTLRDRSEAQLRAIIEQARPDATASDTRKIAGLYASFMDERAADKLGLSPLAAEFARVDALADKRDIPALTAHLAALGVNVPIAAGVDQDARDSSRYAVYLSQGGLGLPDRDYYLKDEDAKLVGIRTEYAQHVAAMLVLAGESGAAAVSIVALETELARGQWTKVENRDAVKTYNKLSLAELAGLVPGYDWPQYFAATGMAGRMDYAIVRQPSYFAGLSKLIADTPLPVWKAYFKWRLLDAYAPYLGEKMVAAGFAFSGTVLRGVAENRPRWKRGVELVEQALGEGLGRIYVARHFPPENKARMQALVANLLAAYRQSIETLAWMSPETRRAALVKLSRFNAKIGYPDEWRDYGALEFAPGDLVGNVMRARRFDYDWRIAKLGKPIARGEWHMTPQTVNAYYSSRMNEIVFPAAILQPPFFNPEADDAVNYGGIGAVIGHEISHGFDDQGSQSDGEGNLRDWWTEQDHEKFRTRTRALVAQYAARSPLPGYPVNGELTLGENIADNSGLAIALKAYKLSLGGAAAPVLDGYSGEQRLFIGWAQVWRGLARESETIRLIKIDPHAPQMVRGTLPLQNQDAFHAAFGIKPGDAMYLAPEKRVSIW